MAGFESSKLSSVATSRSQRRAWPLSGIGGSTCEDEVDFRGFLFRGSYSTDDNPWKRTKTLEGSFSSSKLDGPLMEGQFQVKDDNPRWRVKAPDFAHERRSSESALAQFEGNYHCAPCPCSSRPNSNKRSVSGAPSQPDRAVQDSFLARPAAVSGVPLGPRAPR